MITRVAPPKAVPKYILTFSPTPTPIPVTYACECEIVQEGVVDPYGHGGAVESFLGARTQGPPTVTSPEPFVNPHGLDRLTL